jgi:hypothetical protein
MNKWFGKRDMGAGCDFERTRRDATFLFADEESSRPIAKTRVNWRGDNVKFKSLLLITLNY